MSEDKINPLKLSDSVYDFIKGVVLYFIPGAVTLWLTLGSIWDIPRTTEVGGTLGAIGVFLGIFVGVSKSAYKRVPEATDGDLLMDIREEGSALLTVALENQPDELRDKDTVTFRVVRNDVPN